MKVLVIGGSYFFGRWFVELAHKSHEVTVLNRGNIPINIPGREPMVRELICDRHDEDLLADLPSDDYDIIVDFCAYAPGDIKTIAGRFGREGVRYFFISTVDVYQRGVMNGNPVTEDAPLEDRPLPGDTGTYISGKVSLEKELIEVCDSVGMTGVSIRPGILYGPANYAPREKMFFDWIRQAGQVILPSDSDGHFQFLYVADGARGLLKLCELPENKLHASYNFCNSVSETYDSFARELHRAVGGEFEEIRMPVREILEKQIPLPYPLTAAESACYSTERFRGIGLKETPFFLEDAER